MTKNDPLDDLEEEIVFAPPEGSDEDDDLNDPPEIAGPPLNLYRPHLWSPRSAPIGQGSVLRQSYAKTSLSPIVDTGSRSPNGPDFHALRLPKSPTDRSRSTSEAHHLNTVSRPGRRTSTASLFSMNLEAVPVDLFQQRRKRAAKLTRFFGTDYRSMFGEVLESIEVGVLDDQTRGTLSEEEAAVSSSRPCRRRSISYIESTGTAAKASWNQAEASRC